MGRGLRSNVGMAFRAVKRDRVKTHPVTEQRDAERFARIQATAEAGKAAREARDAAREAEPQAQAPMEGISTAAPAPEQTSMSVDAMDIDDPGQSKRGIPLTKKKKMKLQAKKKKDGINQFHKRKGKGKKKGSQRKK